MIKKYLILFTLAAVIFSCNNQPKKEPVTDIDVANTFVRDLLDNDFKEAEKYLLKDETNNQIFERFKKQYSGKDKAILEKYRRYKLPEKVYFRSTSHFLSIRTSFKMVLSVRL